GDISQATAVTKTENEDRDGWGRGQCVRHRRGRPDSPLPTAKMAVAGGSHPVSGLSSSHPFASEPGKAPRRPPEPRQRPHPSRGLLVAPTRSWGLLDAFLGHKPLYIHPFGVDQAFTTSAWRARREQDGEQITTGEPQPSPFGQGVPQRPSSRPLADLARCTRP